MKKTKLLLVPLLYLICIMSGCSPSEDLVEQENNNKTISIKEAIAFLNTKNLKKGSLTSKAKEANPEFDKITHEKIFNSDQLLTVIPLSTNDDTQNSRILLLKIDNEIKSVTFNMYPEKSSTKGNFSGKILIQNLDGDFINGFRVKNGHLISQFVKSNKILKNSLLNKEIEPTELNEVIVSNNYHNTYYFDLGYFNWYYGGSSFANNYLWDYEDSYNGDSGGNGGYIAYGGGGEDSTEEDTNVSPSCESFNFTTKSGSLWQESAVVNIHFNVVVISPNGYRFSQIIEFPNAILFGAPTNLTIGNTSISSGLAANLSAQAVQTSMDETVSIYGNKPVSELTVRLYFEERLKYNYPLFLPGGRVNFNATSFSGVTTNYKTNMFGTGNCN